MMKALKYTNWQVQESISDDKIVRQQSGPIKKQVKILSQIKNNVSSSSFEVLLP